MRELYLTRYNKLIEYAKRHVDSGYSEMHHIVPRSLGGTDQATNLIKLPSRMHFLAHWMLWKAYNTDELAYAFWAMCHQKKAGQEERYTKINSKTYAILKERRSKTISKSNTTRWHDPVWANNMKEILKKSASTPEEKARRSKQASLTNEKYKEQKSKRMKELWANPEWVKSLPKRDQTTRIKPLLVEGTQYQLINDVAVKYNISISTVRQRIKSQSAQFINWQYL